MGFVLDSRIDDRQVPRLEKELLNIQLASLDIIYILGRHCFSVATRYHRMLII